MWLTGTVVERTDWNEKLFSLKIVADIGPFIPGQFIKLALDVAGKRVARAYSLINPPGNASAEVLIVRVEGGLLSPLLHQLKIGDAVQLSTPATGFMTLAEIPPNETQDTTLWMFATGTAVGPFLSILSTAEPWQRFTRQVLVYGVRQLSDLAYWSLLQAWMQQHTSLQVIPCVTRDSAVQDVIKSGLSCRIPEGLQDGRIESLAGTMLSATSSQVLLCGNPGMVHDVNAWLEKRGLRKNLRRQPGQITQERYW